MTSDGPVGEASAANAQLNQDRARPTPQTPMRSLFPILILAMTLGDIIVRISLASSVPIDSLSNGLPSFNASSIFAVAPVKLPAASGCLTAAKSKCWYQSVVTRVCDR